MRSVIPDFENEVAGFGLERIWQTAHAEATVVCKKELASLNKSTGVSFIISL